MKIKIPLRATIYISIIIFFVLGIVYKQNRINKELESDSNTIYTIYKNEGKPVKISKITKSTFTDYNKIALKVSKENELIGYVTLSIKENLKLNEVVDIKSDKIYKAKIVNISDEIETKNGLYKIKLKIESNITNQSTLIAFLPYETFTDVIIIPSEAVFKNSQETFVWTVKDSLVQKTPIKILKEKGFGTIIEYGLKPGESLVIEGQQKLFENDKIKIIK